jgi:hypothetical protein
MPGQPETHMPNGSDFPGTLTDYFDAEVFNIEDYSHLPSAGMVM